MMRFCLATACLLGESAIAQPVDVRLPETDYQIARQIAADRYATATTECGLIHWSSRLACDNAALEEFQRAEREARRAYVKVQTDMAEEAVRNARKPAPK